MVGTVLLLGPNRESGLSLVVVMQPITPGRVTFLVDYQKKFPSCVVTIGEVFDAKKAVKTDSEYYNNKN